MNSSPVRRLVDTPCRTDAHGFEVRQQKRMVPSTAGMGGETVVESRLSEVGNEGICERVEYENRS